MNNIKNIYETEIENIKKDEDILSIVLVGSSKYLNFEKDYINDIDLFILTKNGDKQIRIQKNIDGVEFDLNYFSINVANEFIKNKEYFFLKEMKSPKIIFNTYERLNNLIELCNKRYLSGPKKKAKEEIEKNRLEIKSNIDKLKYKSNYEEVEYIFLTNLYLKDLLKGYFIKNNLWIPKDKKIIESIKENDIYILKYIERIYRYYQYEDFFNLYNYIFE